MVGNHDAEDHVDSAAMEVLKVYGGTHSKMEDPVVSHVTYGNLLEVSGAAVGSGVLDPIGFDIDRDDAGHTIADLFMQDFGKKAPAAADLQDNIPLPNAAIDEFERFFVNAYDSSRIGQEVIEGAAYEKITELSLFRCVSVH